MSIEGGSLWTTSSDYTEVRRWQIINWGKILWISTSDHDNHRIQRRLIKKNYMTNVNYCWWLGKKKLSLLKKQKEKNILNCRNERNTKRNKRSLWSNRWFQTINWRVGWPYDCRKKKRGCTWVKRTQLTNVRDKAGTAKISQKFPNLFNEKLHHQIKHFHTTDQVLDLVTNSPIDLKVRKMNLKWNDNSLVVSGT